MLSSGRSHATEVGWPYGPSSNHAMGGCVGNGRVMSGGHKDWVLRAALKGVHFFLGPVSFQTARPYYPHAMAMHASGSHCHVCRAGTSLLTHEIMNGSRRSWSPWGCGRQVPPWIQSQALGIRPWSCCTWRPRVPPCGHSAELTGLRNCRGFVFLRVAVHYHRACPHVEHITKA